jgi:Tfp pilus assembly protein PilF
MREGIPLARFAAHKALEIDPSLREAHAVLGNLAAAYDYDWEEARRHFGLAMAREPVPPDVRCNYGYWYLLFSQGASKAFWVRFFIVRYHEFKSK